MYSQILYYVNRSQLFKHIIVLNIDSIYINTTKYVNEFSNFHALIGLSS